MRNSMTGITRKKNYKLFRASESGKKRGMECDKTNHNNNKNLTINLQKGIANKMHRMCKQTSFPQFWQDTFSACIACSPGPPLCRDSVPTQPHWLVAQGVKISHVGIKHFAVCSQWLHAPPHPPLPIVSSSKNTHVSLTADNCTGQTAVLFVQPLWNDFTSIATFHWHYLTQLLVMQVWKPQDSTWEKKRAMTLGKKKFGHLHSYHLLSYCVCHTHNCW